MNHESCEECEKAQTRPYHCVSIAGCETCTIRSVSNQPRTLREQFLDSIADEEKREATRAAISAEWRRRTALICDAPFSGEAA